MKVLLKVMAVLLVLASIVRVLLSAFWGPNGANGVMQKKTVFFPIMSVALLFFVTFLLASFSRAIWYWRHIDDEPEKPEPILINSIRIWSMALLFAILSVVLVWQDVERVFG